MWSRLITGHEQVPFLKLFIVGCDEECERGEAPPPFRVRVVSETEVTMADIQAQAREVHLPEHATMVVLITRVLTHEERVERVLHDLRVLLVAP